MKFVGNAENLAPGFWVGIQYDEPLGKHDGMYVFKLFSFNPLELQHIICLKCYEISTASFCYFFAHFRHN